MSPVQEGAGGLEGLTGELCDCAEASGEPLEAVGGPCDDAEATGELLEGAEAAGEIADVGLGAGLSLRHTEVVLGLVEHRVVLFGRLNVALWTLQWGLDP